MATAKKPKAPRPADPKDSLKSRIEQAKTVFTKHKTKTSNDPKRRLALKKLKRAQRGLARIVKIEKKAAEAAKPKAAE